MPAPLRSRPILEQEPTNLYDPNGLNARSVKEQAHTSPGATYWGTKKGSQCPLR